MSSKLQTLARRGLETAHTYLTATEDQDEPVVQISATAVLVFMVTVMIFIIAIFLVSYTLQVVLTLCMIESPETNSYVPVNTLSSSEEPPAYAEDDDGLPKPTDPDVPLVRKKPFTTSIRQTIEHLKVRAGYWSKFRGLGLFFVYNFLRNIIVGMISLGSRNPLAVAFAAILADVALAHVHMTWIHVVISEPSERKWWKRIPTFRGNWIKIVPAVLLLSVTTQVVHILPMVICGSFGALKQMDDPNFNPGKKHIYITATQLFMAMLLTLILFVTLMIPASVTMVRVAASMLPEEDETIVPFDRTFGGKTTPTIIGGQGKIGLVEAWRSFPWHSRKRLLMLCVKTGIIIVSLWVSFTVVIVAEAHLMFGEEALKDIMRTLHGIRRPH